MGAEVGRLSFQRSPQSQSGMPCHWTSSSDQVNRPAGLWGQVQPMPRRAASAKTSLGIESVSENCGIPTLGPSPRRFGVKVSTALWFGRVVVAMLCVQPAVAQSLSLENAAIHEQEQRFRAEREQLRRAMLTQAKQRSRAHVRIGARPAPPASIGICPVLSNQPARPGMPKFSNPKGVLDQARFARAYLRPRSTAKPTDPASDYFSQHISQQVIQAKCISCHNQAGLSGHTRIVLAPSSTADHEARNLEVFRTFTANVHDGADTILNKIRGVAHGGGIQVFAGSADFSKVERFVRLLDGGATSSDLSPETLLDGVTMASPAETLRRAALIFAGRPPTAAEVRSVSNGRTSSLRSAIRGLMSGKAFHEFLIRASNDRLLTDRHLDHVIDFSEETNLVDLANLNWRKSQEAIQRGYEWATEDPIYAQWEESTQFGIARAPLELIAYVVESDRPYTEILTADYVMTNPMTAKSYGDSTEFSQPNAAKEFRPSKILSYYRNNYSKTTEVDVYYGTRVVNSGNLYTDYPHAGILSSRVFLRRYPTTEINRNRARARWAYYHFLGLDIERSASRATDPVALTDTDNPTMKNSACTVCHNVMDPVAGTFQNYDEEGNYKNNFGGVDSLALSYRYPDDGQPSLYQEGDTWYRDMLAPGFDGKLAPSSDNSLQWLAEQIVADDRFAEATVRFWWPAIMGVEIARPPDDQRDHAFEGGLIASHAQAAEVKRIAEAFRAGIDGRPAFNAKDLFAEIALSPWFRAQSVVTEDPARRAALSEAGVERLLGPEELARKTQAITGYTLGRRISGSIHEVSRLDGEGTFRGGEYELIYGGIDSDGIAERARSISPLMAAVAQSHALQVSCAVVQREFFMLPEQDRRLFRGIGVHTTPISGPARTVMKVDSDQPRSLSWRIGIHEAGDRTLRLSLASDRLGQVSGTNAGRQVFVERIQVADVHGDQVVDVDLERLRGQGCGELAQGTYVLPDDCSLRLPVYFPKAGEFSIETVARQDAIAQGADRLAFSLAQDRRQVSGAAQIRSKLVELHWKLFGVQAPVDSPDIEEAFQLFSTVWERKRRTEGHHFSDSGTACPVDDTSYFQGIIEDSVVIDEWGDSEIDWDRVDAAWNFDLNDSSYAARTWVIVLAALMSDYRYLYL